MGPSTLSFTIFLFHSWQFSMIEEEKRKENEQVILIVHIVVNFPLVAHNKKEDLIHPTPSSSNKKTALIGIDAILNSTSPPI